MAIKAVLFDMGGVIVKLNSIEDMIGPSALSFDEVWEAWILSDAVQEFERGRCDVASFADRIVAEMQIEGTASEFIDRFVAFPDGLFPGAIELVESVNARVTTGILSNTNGLHWANQKSADVISTLCHRSYLSFELGLAKPHREIYDHVVADLGLPADQVLFIDDNQINVDGARAVGMVAEIAKGPDEAGAVLRNYGVL